MLKEFKEFAMKGNVIDLAVGVIIGAAFGKIVESVVNDMIMPVITPTARSITLPFIANSLNSLSMVSASFPVITVD